MVAPNRREMRNMSSCAFNRLAAKSLSSGAARISAATSRPRARLMIFWPPSERRRRRYVFLRLQQIGREILVERGGAYFSGDLAAARQVDDLLAALEAEGAAGLVDRRLGRASGRRAPLDQIEWVLEQYRTRYWEKHFHEHLVRDHGFRLGYTWTKIRLQEAPPGRTARGGRAGPVVNGAPGRRRRGGGGAFKGGIRRRPVGAQHIR